MFDRLFGFSAPPFQLSPDARFFFASRGHARAMAHLTFGLEQGEGFVVVTGEVGAGKTTLVEHLLTLLDRNTHAVARIATTQLDADALFRLAASGLGVDTDRTTSTDKAGLIRRFEAALAAHRRAGRRAILIVDEAQNLTREAIEELRMLSNLSVPIRAGEAPASLQTILLGQPEFRAILASPELDQLRSRVTASYHLAPLAPDETGSYLEHRLAAVGWTGRPAIASDAAAAVHAHTDGVPRRINRLFSRVLLRAALDEALEITAAMVEQTAAELAADLDGPAGKTTLAPRATPDAMRDRLDAFERRLDRCEELLSHLHDLFKASQ